MERVLAIEKELEDLRKQLKEHVLYESLHSIEDVRIFMEQHVFAVWDFMSLLKALQRHLTCVSLPWIPVVNSKTARFINEIVLEEETDVNELGAPKSHFEMYIDAMGQTKANTKTIATFLSDIIDGNTTTDALNNLPINKETKDFLAFTFSVIQTAQPHIIAASFTFGREDVIPDMFLKIVKHTEEKEAVDYGKLTYYLNRHIELDGGDHGPLSLQMITELCGEDEQKWQDVLYYSRESLEKRIALWNGISKSLQAQKISKEFK